LIAFTGLPPQQIKSPKDEKGTRIFDEKTRKVCTKNERKVAADFSGTYERMEDSGHKIL
jgi:hypothetical protein